MVVSAAIWASFECLFEQQFGHRSSVCFGSQLGHCSSGCFDRNLGIVRQKITVMRGARLCLRAMLSIRTSDFVLTLEKG